MKNLLITILVVAVLVFTFLFFTEKKSDISYEPWPETEPATVRPTTNTQTSSNNTSGTVTTSTQGISQSNPDCMPGASPSIKIIYPNGGEIFTTDQKINIKWTTCNIDSNSSLGIGLAQGSLGNENVEGPGGFGMTLANATSNDGSEIIDLSEKSFDGDYELSSGRSNFRITVTQGNKNLYEPGVVFDASDSFFTINK